MSGITSHLGAVDPGDPTAAEQLLLSIDVELRKPAAAKLTLEMSGIHPPRPGLNSFWRSRRAGRGSVPGALGATDERFLLVAPRSGGGPGFTRAAVRRTRDARLQTLVRNS